MKILTGTIETNSFDDERHRVKITVPTVCQGLLVENVNGLYLRKGDTAYVAFGDDYIEPLIIGRVSGQLELQNLVDIINGLVDVINKNADTFASHKHVIPVGELLVNAGGYTGSNTNALQVSTSDTFEKANEVTPDDLLY